MNILSIARNKMMKVISSANRRQRMIALFTWTWFIVSIITSAYFAFWVFPKIYEARTGATVRLWFQGKNPDGNPVYWPNTETYRTPPYNDLRDESFLYFSKCDILPLSQRPVCDDTANWTRVDPHNVSCNDVKGCSTPIYSFNQAEKNKYLTNLVPKSGMSFNISDIPAPSWSDPTEWGETTRWPLFLVCLFLAVKLGRALGEFLFLPYDK
jgi:hypothetical protein